MSPPIPKSVNAKAFFQHAGKSVLRTNSTNYLARNDFKKLLGTDLCREVRYARTLTREQQLRIADTLAQNSGRYRMTGKLLLQTVHKNIAVGQNAGAKLQRTKDKGQGAGNGQLKTATTRRPEIQARVAKQETPRPWLQQPPRPQSPEPTTSVADIGLAKNAERPVISVHEKATRPKIPLKKYGTLRSDRALKNLPRASTVESRLTRERDPFLDTPATTPPAPDVPPGAEGPTETPEMPKIDTNLPL